MTKENRHMTDWRDPRPIQRRLIVMGNLVLQSPAHCGNGDAETFSYTDLVLVRDSLDQRPLLPGASITGAVRNYLCERELGYHQAKNKATLSVQLFGAAKGDDNGIQSPLIIHDALAEADTVEIELRDGVKINPETRTAEEKKKFNLETLAAGTVFPLYFELLLPGGDMALQLKQALALALEGLQTEATPIHLGARKRRGLGRANVAQWQVWDFDLTTPNGLLAWLAFEHPDLESPRPAPVKNKDIWQALGLEEARLTLDKRAFFHLKADLTLSGSLLVRSGFTRQANEPDTVQLHLRQADRQSQQPVVPGSSFAGVLRHRALRIATTLLGDRAEALVNEMFGFGCADESMNQHNTNGHGNNGQQPQIKSSRVHIADARVNHVNSFVQSRIQIDRFTGSAHEAKLFHEQPVFGTPDTVLTLDLTLRNPTTAEIGLLLHTLKDLWLGDLPLGGQSSIGRGRVQGRCADLTWQHANAEVQRWHIQQTDGSLSITGDQQALENCGQALLDWKGITDDSSS
ncbi:MAG: hypothetical protein F6K39_41795 [Okeania sp. SIO3B3]|nr:hypothetical protein [Okeania sp. SIO3B3]